MKITRIVNDTVVEYELTKSELFLAFEEQEHIWDCDYVRGLVAEHIPESKVEEIAYEMRRQMNKYDLTIEYAFDEACYACLSDGEDIA